MTGQPGIAIVEWKTTCGFSLGYQAIRSRFEE
jgi:hypothetical protein